MIAIALLIGTLVHASPVPASQAGAPPSAVPHVKGKASKKPSAPTLYSRLGGLPGVRGVIEEFVDTLLADGRLKANTGLSKLATSMDMKKVKVRLSEHFCARAGGPCKPQGPLLERTPEAKLSPLEWFYVIQDANSALNKRKIPASEQQEILALLWKSQS